MILFFFLGSGAGMMNVYRVAGASGGSFGKQRSGDEHDRGA
jgi:F0F1-type ATP synthase assembly protein I